MAELHKSDFDSAKHRRVIELVSRRYWGDLSASDSRELDQLVCGDEVARRWFVDAVAETAAIYLYASGTAAQAKAAQFSAASADAGRATADSTSASGESAAGDSGASDRGASDHVEAAVQPPSSPVLGFLAESLGKALSHSLLFSLAFVLAIVSWTLLAVWVVSWRHAGDSKAVALVAGDASFARLVGAAQCRWQADQPSPALGDSLPGGILHLTTGTAEIELASGVHVLIEGPARFELQTLQQTYLHEGRLSARVPPAAVGYTVATASATIVDLGTEFGVEASASGDTDVQVFVGRVELRPVSSRPGPASSQPAAALVLSASQSKRVEAAGPDGHVVVRNTSGVERPFQRELPPGTRAERAERPDYPPGLVAYWNFDEDHGPAWDQYSKNHGGLVDVERVAGLVGRGAIQFDNKPGQMVRVFNHSGELTFTEGLTVEALFVSRWSGARLDYDEILRKQGPGRTITLSFQNDDNDSVDGPVLAFEITATNNANLDMPLDGRDGRPSLAGLTDGRLHHVAATFDGSKGEVAIFIDGVKCLSRAVAAGTRLTNGGGEVVLIGNYSGNLAEPFNGEIDEVALYRVALSADEIALHWQRAKQGTAYFPGKQAPAANSQED